MKFSHILLSFSLLFSIVILPSRAVAAESTDSWWRNFNDPILDSLIYIGQNNNLDLAQALKRLEVARLSIKQAQSAYYPQLSMAFGWDRERTSARTTRTPGMAMTSSAFSLGVDMSWEIDLFGRITQKVREQKSAYKATREEYDWMCVTIAAEIASEYMSLRTLQQEMEVTLHHISEQERVLKITEARHEAGLASMLDVAQAKTVFYSTKASVASLQTSITTTINSIAVLTATYPAEMQALLSVPMPVPDAQWTLDVDVSPELLRNRPDVLEAEYTVQEMADALGVARKDWLPSLSLTASVGTQAWLIRDLFKSDTFTYSVAPQLSWTIFDGLSREASIASAREQMLAAVDSYNLTLLTAIQEVDSALATYRQALIYENELKTVLENATLAYNLALDRYRQGLDAFINVADAQISALEYANQLVVARGNVLSAIISLQKALTL